MKPLLHILAISPVCLLLSVSCKSDESQKNKTESFVDPGRCVAEDVGEAADFVQQKSIKDDRMIVAHGIANPQALIWRDDNAKQTYYLARILGTEKKLYFLKPVADDETPGVASRFEGHLLKWSNLDSRRAALLTQALAANYNVTFDQTQTYVIIQGDRPRGCN